MSKSCDFFCSLPYVIHFVGTHWPISEFSTKDSRFWPRRLCSSKVQIWQEQNEGRDHSVTTIFVAECVKSDVPARRFVNAFIKQWAHFLPLPLSYIFILCSPHCLNNVESTDLKATWTKFTGSMQRGSPISPQKTKKTPHSSGELIANL